MDIKEIREKKQDVENGILALLDTFYEVTGVRIVTINVITTPFVNNQGGRQHDVDIIVERI